jgi:hypothetical protein
MNYSEMLYISGYCIRNYANFGKYNGIDIGLRFKVKL